jgi:RNA polymerase sigma-70 factor (ECF subfamily)
MRGPDDTWDWDALGRFARSLARRRTASASEADDIAQEALVRAWRSRARCRNPGQPEAWMRQIVLNEVVRHHHRAKRWELTLVDPPEPEDTSSAPLVERLDVRRAVGRLEPLDRYLVALRYLADQTQPAIARELGLPEGTVKVRLHRARARLRDALSSDYDHDS